MNQPPTGPILHIESTDPNEFRLLARLAAADGQQKLANRITDALGEKPVQVGFADKYPTITGVAYGVGGCLLVYGSYRFGKYLYNRNKNKAAQPTGMPVPTAPQKLKMVG